ncbi:carbon-nitrogen hydrolase family protein [Telluribacter sp. SYSU D00476]|uniref:carbon-nitrogen hydrolase family protein n=1 Tax=Telluribacter sp. SYSU D00476 TaxID=2811430 RepID=UPI001FF4A9FA|nr:carbon-nitrogen hydrolase family protein [Telluribacter sp. SYSU D00476]
MKLCVAQTRPVRGDIEQNIESHQKLIELALSHGATTILFPELSITGYEPELAEALATGPDDHRLDPFQQISDERQVTLGIGVPTRSDKGLHISLVVFQPQQDRQLYCKRYLHPDEYPYFVSGTSTTRLSGLHGRMALAICYELSVPRHAEEASRQGASIYLASVAKSVEGVGKAHPRLAEIASTYSMTTLMANSVGYCDTFTCGGRSAIWNSAGKRVGQLDDTSEGLLIYDTDTEEVITEVP